jgi:hypothetical protein
MQSPTPTEPKAPSGDASRRQKPVGSVVAGLKRVALFTTLTVSVFFLIEGCASTLLVLREWTQRPSGSTIRHHDPLLGWVSDTSLSRPQFWSGSGLHTNAQGFRGQSEIASRIPVGRIRVVCSGDSFAFSEQVGDDEAWCHLLTRQDQRLETVNIGLSGYGIDQAYLRYVRDTAPLDYDIHLFTFIGPDLTRVGKRDHYGYAKPYFQLEDDTLVVKGVPVPSALPRLTRFSTWLSQHVRSLELGNRMARRIASMLSSEPAARSERQEMERERIAPLAEQIFRRVQQLSEEKNSVAVFVYLPLEQEFDETLPWADSCEACDTWRPWVGAVMDSLGYNFIDLTPTLREVPWDTAIDFFIPGDGHYTAAGNAWVAETLYDRLRSLPDVASLLESPEDRADGAN